LSAAIAGVSPRGDVHAAIAQAAEATGVNFDYLLAQARLESGLNPSARAPTSSARGLYQFTGATWLRTLDRHGADHGMDWASEAIAGGTVRDPATRAQLLALRNDPQISALMAGELANDNRDYLSGVLGREPDNAELYLAHFLGSDGAGRFLTALSSDPSQSAAALLPKAAAANRSIFFDAAGPRSVGAVMDLLRGRVDAAMNGAPASGFDGLDLAGSGQFLPAAAAAPSDSPAFTGGPVAQEFQAAAAQVGTASMADTLRDTFGLADNSASPAHVRAAYSALRAVGM
jgi:soluble lytic murein transglycosylase-like protein